jgi:adenylate cyclase
VENIGAKIAMSSHFREGFGRSSGTSRTLMAVLHLDVVGYTRLIGLDDLRTLWRLQDLRAQVIEAQAAAYGGRLHQSAGDSLLVTFGSIVGAVDCAISIQQQIAVMEDAQPADQRILFRAGIDLGDVIPDGTDLHGNGVNVAVRLQTVCPVGQVCISRGAYDHVKARLTLPVESMGRLNLKNIAEPVEAFVLHAHPGPAARDGPASDHPVPGAVSAQQADFAFKPHIASVYEPSIAILPFRVLSRRPSDRHLVDGVVDEINHTLAGLKELFVISRGSTRNYDPDRYDISAVGRELGVSYVLYGSVRRSARNLRIQTELADVSDLSVIHSHQYNSSDANIFDLQERIATDVATPIVPHVRERELRRAMRKPARSMTAYDLVLQATDALFKITQIPLLRARELLLEAIALDPDYAPAYTYAAYCSILLFGEGWSTDPANAKAAADFALKAIERDPTDASALAIYGHVQSLILHDFETAMHFLDRAIEAGPNNPLAWSMSSATCGYLGNGKLAVERGERGLRLSPRDTRVFWSQSMLGQAFYIDEDYEKAIVWTRRAFGVSPTAIFNLRTLIASLVAQGDLREAAATAQRLLQLFPGFRLGPYAARCPFRGDLLVTWIERLRLGGLPD